MTGTRAGLASGGARNKTVITVGGNAGWHQTGAAAALWLVIRRPSQPLIHDPRIRAAVIADPLAVMFAAGSFTTVAVPVQPSHSQLVGDGVSTGTFLW